MPVNGAPSGAGFRMGRTKGTEFFPTLDSPEMVQGRHIRLQGGGRQGRGPRRVLAAVDLSHAWSIPRMETRAHAWPRNPLSDATNAQVNRITLSKSLPGIDKCSSKSHMP